MFRPLAINMLHWLAALHSHARLLISLSRLAQSLCDWRGRCAEYLLVCSLAATSMLAVMVIARDRVALGLYVLRSRIFDLAEQETQSWGFYISLYVYNQPGGYHAENITPIMPVLNTYKIKHEEICTCFIFT